MGKLLEPKRGGTFFYCPWNCYRVGTLRRTRFRTARACRRHLRREHS